MKKLKNRTTVIILAMFFATTLSGLAYATTLKCTVDTVKDGIVTMNCGSNADKLHPGQKIKVRPETKRKAVEGC